MKIEKISETQIRCTLSKQDLAERGLRLSELAYGSEKAKDLFRELMMQASYECDFEAEDIPLMIEAIPVPGDCLVLMVTKVEDPDELDTRFSNFSIPKDITEEEEKLPAGDSLANEILECFGQLGSLLGKDLPAKDAPASFEDTLKEAMAEAGPVSLVRAYSFKDLNTTAELAKLISSYFFGKSTLYKDETSERFYLEIHMDSHTPEEFNRICNAISEYGSMENSTPAALSYYAEHFKVILATDAVPTLAVL